MFIHQLWITLAILASCGLSGLAHGSPQWVLGGATGIPQSTFVHNPDLFGKATTSAHQRGVAKRPSNKAEAKVGHKIPGNDGDGSGHDPLWHAATFDLSRWLSLDAARTEWIPSRCDRVLKGMQPEEGGKRGPPVA